MFSPLKYTSLRVQDIVISLQRMTTRNIGTRSSEDLYFSDINLHLVIFLAVIELIEIFFYYFRVYG